MNKDEALKLALEALKYPLNQSHENFNVDMAELLAHRAITAIKEALAQPEPWEKFCDSNCVWTDHHPDCKLAEQEPVVWMYVNKSSHEVRFQKHMRDFVDHGAFSEVPLFSEPLANQEKTSGSPIAQRKPLTDEEIGDIAALYYPRWQGHEGFARAIEAAHGIKGEA